MYCTSSASNMSTLWLKPPIYYRENELLQSCSGSLTFISFSPHRNNDMATDVSGEYGLSGSADINNS